MPLNYTGPDYCGLPIIKKDGDAANASTDAYADTYADDDFNNDGDMGDYYYYSTNKKFGNF